MKTVKNANLPIKVAGFLIFAAVLVYLAIYGLRLLENPYRTVQALNTTLRDSAHTRGMVVRQEEVLTSVYNTVYITAEEGKRVSGGDGLAEAFDSEEGLRRAVRMGELSQRISSLETQQNRFAAENLQQLEGEIQDACALLRSSALRRSLDTLEEASLSLQSLTFTAFGDTTEVAARLQAYQKELSELQHRGSDRSAVITSPRSGLFSSVVDGWEDLSPSALEGLGAEELRSLLSERREAGEKALCKLVYGNRWYYAALMEDGAAQRLRRGQRASVRFGRYYGQELSMTVESISPEENGYRAVVFSCSTNLADVLSMRRQEAELIFSQETGLRIPRQALRVRDDGGTYVYVQTGLRAEARDVELVHDFGDYYMVRGENLHAGDEIIVSGKGLFDGKVVAD
ncbi:MAG: hypothetical protein IKG89_09345 [Oscillospiraceae bacterium]|nr:hypothetical protein [Oscillospiraceae bacterium]